MTHHYGAYFAFPITDLPSFTLTAFGVTASDVSLTESYLTLPRVMAGFSIHFQDRVQEQIHSLAHLSSWCLLTTPQERKWQFKGLDVEWLGGLPPGKALCGMWGDMNSFLEQADLAFKQRRKSSFRERGGGSVHLGSWQMFYFSTLFPHETHLCSFHWIQPDTALHIFPLKASPWCTTQTLSSKSHSWGTPQWPQLCVQCSPSIDISLVFRKKERKRNPLAPPISCLHSLIRGTAVLSPTSLIHCSVPLQFIHTRTSKASPMHSFSRPNKETTQQKPKVN